MKGKVVLFGIVFLVLAALWALPIYGQHQTKIYFDRGGNRMVVAPTGQIVIQSGGAVVVTPGAQMNTLYHANAGRAIVCGSTVITGTGTLPHGLATPIYVNLSLKEDLHVDHSLVTFTNSAGTVTAKVWKFTGTPTAAQTPVAVDWCVVGVP